VAALEKSYPYEIFNLGNSVTVELSYFIEVIEKILGKEAQKNLLPLQAGDVPETFADIELSRKKLGFDPKVKVEDGIKNFINWYTDYYGRQ
jgi:UDP-glucuronate 4-epimerase